MDEEGGKREGGCGYGGGCWLMLRQAIRVIILDCMILHRIAFAAIFFKTI